jgi:hypothetical protein
MGYITATHETRKGTRKETRKKTNEDRELEKRKKRWSDSSRLERLEKGVSVEAVRGVFTR